MRILIVHVDVLSDVYSYMRMCASVRDKEKNNNKGMDVNRVTIQ